jgi:mono/diheme cytochrome c family protein
MLVPELAEERDGEFVHPFAPFAIALLGCLEQKRERTIVLSGLDRRDDLVAYIRPGLPSVPGATPPPAITRQGAAVEGALLYQRYGCVNCHGPNGLGGVPNPQSPDKAIPALSGADFFKEFNTDQKIIDVIRSGSVIGRAPIVSMPHWGGIIPDSQLRALVAYIKTLKTG